MACKSKMKTPVDGRPEEPAKRRKVGFTGVAETVSCKANDCIKVMFVSSPDEMQETSDKEEIMCDVQFAERIFGEDGWIYGYHDLEIDLWLQSNTFHAYVDIRFSGKAASGKSPPTDIMSKLKETFGDGLTDDREAFAKSISGNSLHFEKMILEKSEAVSTSWVVENDSHHLEDRVGGDESNIRLEQVLMKSGKIVRLELSDPDVRAWHARLNPLSLFYIEGARPIVDNDPLWEVYLSLEIQDNRKKVTGFCNVYRFYHYPDSTRLRVSQILVLPLYQGMGYGLHLLESVNETAVARGCYDVTMEEPSINLQKMRDIMDVLRLLSVPTLSEQVKTSVNRSIERLHSRKAFISSGPEDHKIEMGSAGSSNGSRTEPSQYSWKEGNILCPPRYLRDEVRKTLKISKKQFKRCWEQLLFLHLDPEDKELQEVFQEGLVQRLNSELFEKDKDMEKHANKQIFDMENEYNDSVTFIMLRVRCKAPGRSNGPSPMEIETRSVQPPAEEKVKALQESLSEREEDLFGVACGVARHCMRLGIPIPTIEYWLKREVDQAVDGTSSP
ncbi:hypothetical protein R1flu_027961 [Riccia fluitans]|uniref:histone acetyltransferase n=1 Tax=Riccia fluitans TaxID=41844 RepID=A0ABD1XPC2_9MARC